MFIVIRRNEAEVGRKAGAIVAEMAKKVGPKVVLGVATGSSPLSTYAELARLVSTGELDLSQASAFALDEYVGLPVDHPESYHATIHRTVTEPLGLDPARVHVPDGNAQDLDTAAADYEAMIEAAGGIDVQILGVGANGHIGFNEPSSSLASRTRMKVLTQETRRDNARFFDSLADVPRYSMTQGLGTIMDARRIVLVATGANKAKAVQAMVEGPITSMCPGSVLQWHRRVTVVIDLAAAADLRLTDYYRDVYANLPHGPNQP